MMMFDFVGSMAIRHEVEMQAERRRLERDDPDQLYRYEGWYSIGAAPTLKERLLSVIQRFRRKDSKIASKQETCAPIRESVPST